MKKVIHDRKVCFECKKSKVIEKNYYTTKSKMFPDGKAPYCKACILKMIDLRDLNNIKAMFAKLDIPFVAKVWRNAESHENETFGTYMRFIRLEKNRETYADSDFEGEEYTEIYKHTIQSISDVNTVKIDGETVVVNDEIVFKFGTGYTNREYLDMEKYYRDMKFSYDITLPQHTQQLVTLCKINIMADRALKEGDTTAFKNLDDRRERILQSAGWRPIDRKGLDEQTGIKSFGQIFADVEAHGYVEPKNIAERFDLVDMCIHTILNYYRRLIGHEKIEENPDEIQKALMRYFEDNNINLDGDRDVR